MPPVITFYKLLYGHSDVSIKHTEGEVLKCGTKLGGFPPHFCTQIDVCKMQQFNKRNENNIFFAPPFFDN